MRVLLISTLPDIHEFFGLRHHYPVVGPAVHNGGLSGTMADVTDPEGTTSFALFVPGRAGSFPDSISGFLRADGTEGTAGPVVAHLSGTSVAMRSIADELRSRSVPYLYSPMLPAIPSRFAAFAGRLSPDRGSVAPIAAAIADSAFRVIVEDDRSGEFFRRRVGMAAGRIITLPAPPVEDGILAGRATGFGNLALAFCDAITPDWNVMHFLFAMEKINADAVLVAGGGERGGDGTYWSECAARAALNPRVNIFRFGSNRSASLHSEIGGFIARATVIVDPSVDGLGGAIAASLAQRGIPGVVSLNSARVASAKSNLFSFEPSSWELLNHAITSAFNAAVGERSGAAGTELGGAAGAVTGARTGPLTGELAAAVNAETARSLRKLYREAAQA